MSSRMPGPTTNIKNRPPRPNNRGELFKQLAIERFVVKLVDELPRISLGSEIIDIAEQIVRHEHFWIR